ncbi:uncharacterized protein PG986_007412 [Apiospora aurea]|uniref:Uncharacterized protein n=1 Tax=Apiospora aurea TaxID=335848 RepID=A0ABR1QCI1_9PEZI
MASTTGIPGEEKQMTLDDIHMYHTLHTNLRATYGTRWEPWEAFRELVQNCRRDGIIRSFHLEAGKFKVIREKASEYEITYKVPAWPQDDEANTYLGYIRFSGSEEGGKVEMVNRKATIQPSHFDLGGTTKQTDEHQAGEHGDGLKVALLILLRAPPSHSISCIAGGFRWEPRFDQHGKLVVQLTRMHAHELGVEEGWNQGGFEKGLVPLPAKPQEDVKFIIGLGNSVKVRDFNEWTKAALFLQNLDGHGGGAGDNGPGAIPAVVSTAKGDLITSEALRGNIYLKGLLLKASKSNAVTGQESASITGKPLRFGYNFAQGKTNRDRQSLAGAFDEANAVFAIWAQVLQKEPTLIGEFHHMMNTRQPEYADVSQAGARLGLNMITRLKSYLLSKPFEKRWYYTRREKDMDKSLEKTIEGFDREPFALKEPYWDLLYSRGIVRTSEEEKRRRFLRQGEQPAPDTGFSKGVHWYLRACLKSCRQTSEIRFLGVEGLGLHPTTLWESQGNVARVHKSWFIPGPAAHELGLSIATDSPMLFFHTVKHIFSKHHPTDGGTSTCPGFPGWPPAELLKKRLRVSVSGPSHQPELLVSWGPDASWKTAKGSLLVEVHQVSTCTSLKDKLLAGTFPRFIDSSGVQNASTSFGSEGQATFPGLRENEAYFAVVCNTAERDSFIVVSENTVVMPRATAPPPPPQPEPPVVKKRTYSKHSTPLRRRTVERVIANPSSQLRVKNGENLDIMTPRKWYDASNDEGQKAVVGIPPEDSSESSAKKTPAKRSAPQTPTAKRARRS